MVLQPQLAATDYAFAFWCHGHKTVTWGHGNFGGDSSEVKAQLWDVKEIQANVGAFAAILADRYVVTWGYFAHGGDSSAVQDQLRRVQEIEATGTAFAAILADRSVVTWGHPQSGGDSSEVQDQLRNVQQIRGSREAFAAILGRWICCFLGRSCPWWFQLCSSRSVEPSVARVCAECKSAFFFVLNDLIYSIHRSCDF